MEQLRLQFLSAGEKKSAKRMQSVKTLTFYSSLGNYFPSIFSISRSFPGSRLHCSRKKLRGKSEKYASCQITKVLSYFPIRLHFLFSFSPLYFFRQGTNAGKLPGSMPSTPQIRSNFRCKVARDPLNKCSIL